MTTLTEVPTAAVRRTVRTMCPMNCNPTYCGMLVDIEDDRVVAVRGDRENPDSHGFLCIRGQAAGEIVDNPLRLTKPRQRDRRQPDAWRDATWDEALDRIAAAIRHAGREAVAVWHGHGLIVNTVHRQITQRFANLGGFQWWNPAMVCWGLGGYGLNVTGPIEVNTKEDMAANADLILLWGANLVSQPGTAPHLAAAKKRGARVVAIDVRRTEAFAQADNAYLIRPGTDAALALALAHVIIAEGLHDRAFVAAHTQGFDEFVAHVLRYTPAWAATETGIPAETICSLARAFAATPRSMILLGGSSMHKTGNGWQGARAIACLPALTGALGRPGAGFGPRHAAQARGAGLGSVIAEERRPEGDYIPGQMSTILEELAAGRIKVLLLLGTNMLSSFADSGRLEQALAGMDLVVSYDLFMNDTARAYGDVVLPATSWLEETGFKTTSSNLYLMDQAVSPRGEAQTASWLLRGLAGRLGLEDLFPWPDTDTLLTALFDHPSTGHISTGQLRAQGGCQPLAISPVAHPDLRFPTPSGKVEFVSDRAAEQGMPALPVYVPPYSDVDDAESYPLIFRQGRTITHFHGFYDHGQALPTLAAADPEPRLQMSPADAGVRGLRNGQPIRLYNAHGEMVARLTITDSLPAGVVWMRDGWLGINALTSGARTVSDAAVRAYAPAGSAAYEARVQVRAVDD